MSALRWGARSLCIFHSGHLAAGLCGSSETVRNYRDFGDSSYPVAEQGFAR